jgi:hypothetical protein
VPAAAVIPAPIAYIKVVAVKKLVVELRLLVDGPPSWCVLLPGSLPGCERMLFTGCALTTTFTLKKLECSKQAYARIH